MDTQRIIALIIFTFSGLMLWDAWQRHNAPKLPPKTTQAAQTAPANGAAAGTSTVPAAPTATGTAPAAAPTSAAPADGATPLGKPVRVETDKLIVELNTRGGDIRKITLKEHFSSKDRSVPFVLMDAGEKNFHIVQTGLLPDKEQTGITLPNHTSEWTSEKSEYVLNGDALDVVFTNKDAAGLAVTKTWRFKRGSYLAEVAYDIKNDTAQPVNAFGYFQFLRDGNAPEGQTLSSGFFSSLTAGVAAYYGPAVYTDEKKYQKLDFSAIEKGKADFVKQAKDGWVANVQHYFVAAWLPAAGVQRDNYADKVDKYYRAGVRMAMGAVAPGSSGKVSVPVYIGPQETDNLKAIAPGLDLVVDYGIFTIIAAPLFWVLKFIHGFVGNWGWAIIILTILIKGIFYPLNAAAGRSMAGMKVLGPKVEALKARYGDDRVKLNQAMMELWKAEKINPMGGCLPILVQIPVFIALYWVLLGAIELRHAPWIGWITDLSAPDPYFVLPILYAVSMFVQTKINPQPADPVQARVMLFMPIMFSVFFLFFPAGLVLYWFAQNLIGIAQQWYINKTIEKEMAAKAAKKR